MRRSLLASPAWRPVFSHRAVDGVQSDHMSIESIEVRTLLRAHVQVQGAILTEEELSKVWVSYLGCGGTGRWEVREYVRVASRGAREYRVVRGSSIRDVYRSPERGRAAAVGTALNELEAVGGLR